MNSNYIYSIKSIFIINNMVIILNVKSKKNWRDGYANKYVLTKQITQ